MPWELADHLLAPLRAWKSPVTGSTDAVPEEPADEEIEVTDADEDRDAFSPALLSSPDIAVPDISTESSD